jgi:hypothetical protein
MQERLNNATRVACWAMSNIQVGIEVPDFAREWGKKHKILDARHQAEMKS